MSCWGVIIMAKFKVGDLVDGTTGPNDVYGMTIQGGKYEVKAVEGDTIWIKIIEPSPRAWRPVVGGVYCVHSSDFELLTTSLINE